jgi:hypothetical protein
VSISPSVVEICICPGGDFSLPAGATMRPSAVIGVASFFHHIGKWTFSG